MANYDRLSALDSSFLGLEDSNCHMHVGGVHLFEATPLKAANGALDTSFADNGIWLSGSPVNEALFGIAVTGNKIVVGGMRATDVPIVPVDVITYRLDTNGVLDTTFGVGGVGELSSPGAGQEGVRDLAVNAAGDIAMGGESPATGVFSDWFLIRYCGG